MSAKVLATQKRLYDGRDPAFVPDYADLGSFKARMQGVREDAKGGTLGYSLKALRNGKELESLGLVPGMKVLDAGCGPGILLNQLEARFGVRGWGVDLAPLALDRARQAGSKKISYRLAPLHKLPFAAASFDRVLSFDVLEHLDDQSKGPALKELWRVLKPGGRFLYYAVSSRDALTLHWWQRLISGGHWGQDTGAGHSKENFVDPRVLRTQLKKMGANDLRLRYSHSFLALLIDETIHAPRKPVPIPLKRSIKAAEVPSRNSLKRKVLAGLKLIWPWVDLFEAPWHWAGLSNGFYISGQKDLVGRNLL